MNMQRPRRDVVVLDRDGTIVADRDYLDDPAGLAFLPGAAEGLRWLHEHGYRLIVVTNQSGVGRGRFSLQRLEEIHTRLIEMVNGAGARLEGIYFCPHVPGSGCACRKPNTELVQRAAAECGFAPDTLVVVGDKESDIELGRRIGAPAIRITTNDEEPCDATFVARDLIEASRIIARMNATDVCHQSVARPR